jgi:hypothetical protein
MRNLLFHVKTFPKNKAKSAHYTRFESLLALHAKDCKNNDCMVFNCKITKNLLSSELKIICPVLSNKSDNKQLYNIELFEHSLDCNIFCEKQNCDKMKNFLLHNKICKAKDTCGYFILYKDLVLQHTNKCRKPGRTCKLPECLILSILTSQGANGGGLTAKTMFEKNILTSVKHINNRSCSGCDTILGCKYYCTVIRPVEKERQERKRQIINKYRRLVTLAQEKERQEKEHQERKRQIINKYRRLVTLAQEKERQEQERQEQERQEQERQEQERQEQERREQERQEQERQEQERQEQERQEQERQEKERQEQERQEQERQERDIQEEAEIRERLKEMRRKRHEEEERLKQLRRKRQNGLIIDLTEDDD